MKPTIKSTTAFRLKSRSTGWQITCKTLEEAKHYAKTAWEWKGKSCSIVKVETTIAKSSSGAIRKSTIETTICEIAA